MKRPQIAKRPKRRLPAASCYRWSHPSKAQSFLLLAALLFQLVCPLPVALFACCLFGLGRGNLALDLPLALAQQSRAIRAVLGLLGRRLPLFLGKLERLDNRLGLWLLLGLLHERNKRLHTALGADVCLGDLGATVGGGFVDGRGGFVCGGGNGGGSVVFGLLGGLCRGTVVVPWAAPGRALRGRECRLGDRGNGR